MPTSNSLYHLKIVHHLVRKLLCHKVMANGISLTKVAAVQHPNGKVYHSDLEICPNHVKFSYVLKN